ncbi:unnamed protein product [Microthlaspi erraticum]|uniref:Aminotransferase class I/classII large domain-containing protein n=1 Tax=Microthlaspi erraticum TaxID=1685480 RepID=A0A6D2IAB9_9BRAS|nr:unnamed protein product [Microthlaspi erraticum]
MGLPGFQVEVVYSYNDAVVSCTRRMSSFVLVSSQTQRFLAAMLSNQIFVNNFLKEVSKRIAKRNMIFTEGLRNGSFLLGKSRSMSLLALRFTALSQAGSEYALLLWTKTHSKLDYKE